MKRHERSAAMALVVAAVASQVITLAAWGHITYLWVQGVEALVAAVALTVFAIRYRAPDPRPGRWPPLAPLAVIAASGGIKDLLVALDLPTPNWLVVALFAAVMWFGVASWLIWRTKRA
jgi:hypothetical protein